MSLQPSQVLLDQNFAPISPVYHHLPTHKSTMKKGMAFDPISARSTAKRKANFAVDLLHKRPKKEMRKSHPLAMSNTGRRDGTVEALVKEMKEPHPLATSNTGRRNRTVGALVKKEMKKPHPLATSNAGRRNRTVGALLKKEMKKPRPLAISNTGRRKMTVGALVKQHMNRRQPNVTIKEEEESDGKGVKIMAASQKENEMQFIAQLYARQDITHESKAKSVLKKLKREGLVNLPTKTALKLVRLDISRREMFLLCNLQTELTKKLLTVVPCIKEECGEAYYILSEAKVVDTRISCQMFDQCLHLLFGVLDAMRLRFHPVIWKERMQEIYSAIEARARRERSIWMTRWLQNCPKSYSECLRRMKVEYMSSKVYRDAQHVVRLHQEFHKHLAFCDFMKHDNKIENLLRDERVVTIRFEVLDKTLLIASLKARLKLLKEFHELEKYKDWMMHLVQHKISVAKSSMDEILRNIRIEHPTFPYFSDRWKFHLYNPVTFDWTEWTEDEKEKEMSAYYELLKKVKKHTDCQSSYAYLMEGILDYDAASPIIEQEISRKYKDLSAYLSTPSCRYSWLNERAWNETHYDHPAYKIVYDDMLALYIPCDDMPQWIR